jgi:hypothetical protein
VDLGYVESELKGLSNAGDRAVFERIFRMMLRDWRFGHPKGSIPDPSTNMGGGFFYATTPNVANTEFAIVHDFGRTPYLVIPVLPLDEVGAAIVRLQLSRAADVSRLYLKSPDTNVPITLFVEG